MDAPVFYAAANIDHGVVARYEDVKRVLLNPESFWRLTRSRRSHRSARILRDEGWRQALALGDNDPPDHGRFRKNVQRAFTPQRAAELDPFIRASVEPRIEAIASRGRADLMAELIYGLLALVILKLLAIPDNGVPIVREAGDNPIAFAWGRPTDEEQARNGDGARLALPARPDRRAAASPGKDLGSANGEAAAFDGLQCLDIPPWEYARASLLRARHPFLPRRSTRPARRASPSTC